MLTMRIDAERPTSLAYGERALQASPTGGEQGLTSRALCEVMVSTLGRDHTLRHAYLRKRWQGLGFEVGDRGEGSVAERSELMAVRQKLNEKQSVKETPLTRGRAPWCGLTQALTTGVHANDVGMSRARKQET
jgi:hypothetical protein